MSMDLMAGFEQRIIIDLTGGLSAVTTRTLANVMVINFSPVLDQQWTIQNFLNQSHDCNTIMNWTETRARIPASMMSLMGMIFVTYVI